MSAQSLHWKQSYKLPKLETEGDGEQAKNSTDEMTAL